MGLLALQRPTLTGQSACSDLDASSGWDVGRSARGSAVGALASLKDEEPPMRVLSATGTHVGVGKSGKFLCSCNNRTGSRIIKKVPLGMNHLRTRACRRSRKISDWPLQNQS